MSSCATVHALQVLTWQLLQPATCDVLGRGKETATVSDADNLSPACSRPSLPTSVVSLLDGKSVTVHPMCHLCATASNPTP